MDYKTTDTPLAAYLITQGYLPISIDYSNPRYVILFQRDTDISNHASRYISGFARVDPATFHRVSRKLARILHNQLQWGEG